MVLFLLHNTLGAWHAGKVLAKNPSLATTAKDEAELRLAVALESAGGYEFEYLRFVREPNLSSEDASEPGPWRPMGGTYDGWPKTAADLKVLDPSCGSGHFLVAAFELLIRLRMHEEGLSVEAAVESILRDNLFGLEIDPRCTQIAAFNLAMAVWKLTGPKPLPPMRNIACSGIPLGNSRDEWMKSLKVALPNSDLGFQWGQLYDMFSKADTLGSLINPLRFFGSGLITDEQLEQISEALATVIVSDRNATDEQQELAAAAQGLTRATELLSGRYTLVITNVPYLGRGKQDDELKEYLDTQYALGKADLATAFVLRCLEFCSRGGSTSLVTPHNWLFLSTYRHLRESLLENRQIDFIARLGPGAFETIGGEVVNVALVTITAKLAEEKHRLAGIDLSTVKPIKEKTLSLRSESQRPFTFTFQAEQCDNPDARISTEPMSRGSLMKKYASATEGLSTGDGDQFIQSFWERRKIDGVWVPLQAAPEEEGQFGGLSRILRWEEGGEILKEMEGARIQGFAAWGMPGVLIARVSSLRIDHYLSVRFEKSCVILVPRKKEDLGAIFAFAKSDSFIEEVRKLDQKTYVTTKVFENLPFDLFSWKRIAAEQYPNGLPEPESDDPKQWLFHGRPEESTSPLQVAVARLLGYRWPAELDDAMRLSQRAQALVARCSELDEFTDDDGIVCIPSVRGEDPASDRLLRMLHAAGVNHSENLEIWLRDKFFQEHCELFHQRPFIWHIWDGKKEGFAALINYHKLAGPQGKKLLESLTYSYLGDWITRQEAGVKNNDSGADDRLLAAKELQEKLEAILHGEPPYDIFVRWKPLHEQPIGWTPDINDGVRMNIRPFMMAELSRGRRGAGVLRFPPKIKWTKDRGKEPKRPPDDYPWFWGWDETSVDFAGGRKFTGERWNNVHYTIDFKQNARKRTR
jgi:hypothetical protein